MPEPLDFAAILDAAEQLDRGEQAKLMAILWRREAELRRLELADVVAQTRREFAWGQAHPVTPARLSCVVSMGADIALSDVYWPDLVEMIPSATHVPRGVLLRTTTFVRSLQTCSLRAYFDLDEAFDRLAAEAEHPSFSLPKLLGCRVWRVAYNFRILFEPVEYGRGRAILPLALDTSDDGYR